MIASKREREREKRGAAITFIDFFFAGVTPSAFVTFSLLYSACVFSFRHLTFRVFDLFCFCFLFRYFFFLPPSFSVAGNARVHPITPESESLPPFFRRSKWRATCGGRRGANTKHSNNNPPWPGQRGAPEPRTVDTEALEHGHGHGHGHGPWTTDYGLRTEDKWTNGQWTFARNCKSKQTHWERNLNTNFSSFLCFFFGQQGGNVAMWQCGTDFVSFGHCVPAASSGGSALIIRRVAAGTVIITIGPSGRQSNAPEMECWGMPANVWSYFILNSFFCGEGFIYFI